MKKAAAVFSILVFTAMISNPGQAFAAAVQVPLPQSAGLSQAAAGMQRIGPDLSSSDSVGVACALQGEVTASFPDQPARVLKSGMVVYMGETVETGANGRLQLLLKDETTFTLGANSRIVVDDFVYDESSHNGRVEASITKGVFRFITGKIAKKTPSNMTVKLPSATIGVRGTIVAGQIAGLSSQVILLGPGGNNNTGENPGSIHISNERGGEEISRAGYGTFVESQGAPPTAPEIISESRISEITGALNQPPDFGNAPPDSRDPANAPDSGNAPPDSRDPANSPDSGNRPPDSRGPANDKTAPNFTRQDQSPGPQRPSSDTQTPSNFMRQDRAAGTQTSSFSGMQTASNFAKQDLALGTQTSSFSDTQRNFVAGLDNFAKESSLQATSNNSVTTSGSSGNTGSSSVTTINELKTLTGTGNATLSTGTLSPSNGAFTMMLAMDFDYNRVGSTSSKITATCSTIAGNTPLEFNLASQYYTNNTGNAVFTYNVTDANCLATANVTLTFNNADTTIADNVGVNVTIIDTYHPSNTVTGSGMAEVTKTGDSAA